MLDLFILERQTMKRIKLLTYFLLLILCAYNSFTSAQESSDILLNKVDSLFANIDNTESPGAAVLIVKDGKILLNKGYGMANLEHKIPITTTTVFDIASVSKQFAGIAISILIEQGKISLEDDIRQYIPELPDFGHTITINHLIQHTSGLRDWPGTLSLAGLRMDDVISFDQILTMAFNQKELNFIPGSEYSYSNTENVKALLESIDKYRTR